MQDIPRDEPEETTNFPGGWKGLYIFLTFYGILQIVLLYLFTVTLNRH